jgi:hypothetical protein
MITTNTISETKEHQEPKIPESTKKQWKSNRKSDSVNQNPAVFSNQWHIPDVTPKTDTEVSLFSLKVQHCCHV